MPKVVPNQEGLGSTKDTSIFVTVNAALEGVYTEPLKVGSTTINVSYEMSSARFLPAAFQVHVTIALMGNR